jgi:hypothetical protein
MSFPLQLLGKGQCFCLWPTLWQLAQGFAGSLSGSSCWLLLLFPAMPLVWGLLGQSATRCPVFLHSWHGRSPGVVDVEVGDDGAGGYGFGPP